jgi:hypothetical protein
MTRTLALSPELREATLGPRARLFPSLNRNLTGGVMLRAVARVMRTLSSVEAKRGK